MALFVALLALAFVAPAVPLLVHRLGSASAPLGLRRPLILRAALAGGLGIIPVGFLFTLGAYGDWIVLFLICMLGSLYGAIVGVIIISIRAFRHRDRTGERR